MSHWPVHVFKLASSGDARGVSCDADGVFFGAIPLLEALGGVWRIRDVAAINEEFGILHGVAVDLTPKLGGFAVIANALNDNNIIKAKIAAVQLRLPELPCSYRSSHDITDVACDLFYAGILAKTWEPEKHPRWPAGQSDGGRFRPGDGDYDNQDQSTPQEQIAADPARFTECNEKCSKLLERYRTYPWSNVNEFHYRICMTECLALG